MYFYLVLIILISYSYFGCGGQGGELGGRDALPHSAWLDLGESAQQRPPARRRATLRGSHGED